MGEPTIKRSSVTIGFTASDGYKMQVNYSNRGRMGRSPPPNGPLLEAIDELGRLAELFGFGDEAAAKLDEARGRVKAWRAENPEFVRAASSIGGKMT